MKKTNKMLAKVLGIICALTLLVSALYVPMSFSVGAAAIPVADDQTVTFGFEAAEGSIDKDENGLACESWALHAFDASNGVRGVGWMHGNPVAWGTAGGYRLNNKDGVYTLEKSATYIVSFKLNVLASPIKTADITENATSYLKLGYGFAVGGDGNPIGSMKTVVSDVFVAPRVAKEEKDNGTFKLTTAAGVQDYTVGRDTYELTYVFATPDDLDESADTTLGFFAVTHYGVEFVVDDVKVTKLSASKGAVVLVDEYFGKTEVITGEIDAAVELPTLTGTNPEHEFKGWFVDADRTVAAEGLVFSAEVQTVYSNWKAPVTVTFVDSHNNIILQSTGVAGEPIEYPEDPVDLINDPAENWFMGWYTTESYTEEFTATTFGYKSYDVFAKWLSSIPDQVQNFENYNTGVSEWAYGKMMSIVADPTGTEKGKVNKYNWDVNTNKYDTNKYGTIDSTAVMHGVLLEEGNVYTATFDYYVEDLADDVTFTVYPVNGAATNIWQGARVDFRSTQGAKFDITSADKDGAWHQGSFSFTMKYGQPDNTAIHFVMILSKKSNATVYIDNVVFSTAQPYESTITYVHGDGQTDKTVVGMRGEAIPEYVPTGESAFGGWYLDSAFTVPFEQETFGRKPVTVYARWAGKVITFENFSKYYFTDWSLSIKNEAGIGYNDDYALSLDYLGSKLNAEGKPFYERGGHDFTAAIAALANHTVYDIKYYVNVLEADVDLGVMFAFGHDGNVWEGIEIINESRTTITKDNAGNGWIEKSFRFTTDFVGNHDDLYIMFNIAGANENTKIDALVDRIEIVEVIDPVVVLNTGVSGMGLEYIYGKAGEEIPFPELDNSGLPFLGWYTDKEYTQKFEGTTFINGTIVLYGKWEGIAIEFKPFTKHYYTKWSLEIEEGEGLGYKDDAALFFDYKGTKIVTDVNQSFFERGSLFDHCMALTALQNNKTYEISYFVKTDKANSNYTIRFGMAHDGNIWEGVTWHNETVNHISKSAAGDGWVQYKTLLTTNFTNERHDDLYIFFGVNTLKADTEIQVYVDRIVINEVENSVLFDANTDEANSAYQIGNVGDKINFPTLVNGSASLLGWYTDKACTVKFEGSEMVEGNLRLYAKWTAKPFTFENFKYNTNNLMQQGALVNTVEGAGVGYDDNFKLSFYGKGSDVRGKDDKGNDLYWGERLANLRDNCVRFGTLNNHTAYKISYYYKSAADANVDTNVSFAIGRDGNIWEPAGYVNLEYTKKTVAVKETDWQYAEVIIFTDFLEELGNTLFMQFGALKNGKDLIAGVDIDNVLITELDAPYVFYNGMNNNYVKFVQGSVGGAIERPASEPVRVGYDFNGWYLDKDCTIPFTNETFKAGDKLAVYAGYVKSSKVLYTLENFQFTNPQGWFLWDIANGCGEYGIAYSGTHAFFFDRDPDACGNKWEGICVGDGTEIFKLDATKKYVVTFKYYVEKQGSSDAKVAFWSGHDHNRYHNSVKLTDDYIVNIMEEVGKWHTGALVIDPKSIKEECEYLFLIVDGGQDFRLYFDDVEITTLPDGHTGYVVDNGGCENVPMYITGAIGSSFANQLPKDPKYDNHKFQGYKYFDANNNSDTLTPDKMVFSEEKMRIVANFVRLKTVMDFEEGYKSLLESHGDYSAADYDYELYDANKEGNSKDNVTSGRYALHRKGTSMYFENAQLVTQDKMLSNAERYTITMKVKLGKYLQTDGAVKIASCRSPYYAWTTTGDYHAIVAIKDLLDGEWHEVSYTFNSVEAFLAIQTPGYAELFIDDVVITWVDKETPLSSSVSYTEYVPAKRDADGNLVDVPAAVIDVDSIIDESLLNKKNGGFDMIYLIIGGAALVLVAAAAVIVIILKKRKAKKA